MPAAYPIIPIWTNKCYFSRGSIIKHNSTSYSLFESYGFFSHPYFFPRMKLLPCGSMDLVLEPCRPFQAAHIIFFQETTSMVAFDKVSSRHITITELRGIQIFTILRRGSHKNINHQETGLWKPHRVPHLSNVTRSGNTVIDLPVSPFLSGSYT